MGDVELLSLGRPTRIRWHRIIQNPEVRHTLQSTLFRGATRLGYVLTEREFFAVLTLIRQPEDG